MVQTVIKADYDGKPLSVLQKVIQERVSQLHQTLGQALDATAVMLLKSLRALTKVAKLEKFNIEQVSELKVSFEKIGFKSRPCLRYRGSDVHFYPGEKDIVKFTSSSLVDSKNASVFSFTLGYGKSARRYFVGACSSREARQLAKEIQRKRLKRYSGLAKLAMGTLMWKVASKQPSQSKVTGEAQSAARANTRIVRHSDSALELHDELNYAELALRHGRSDIDLAAARAANSIVGMINRRLQSKGLTDKIATPFEIGV